MKIFTVIILLLLSSELYSKNDVLEPNQKVGRLSKVLSNKVIIRVKPGYDIFNKQIILRSGMGISDISQLLSPQNSLTYNSLLSVNYDYKEKSKIYQAEEKLLRTFTIIFDDNIEPEEFCRRILLANPAIEIAEPYYLPEFFSSYKPNDEMIDMQDDFLTLIKAYEAWSIEKGDPNVIIGISDSGTNQQHEDIIGNLAFNDNEIPNDGLDNDDNGYIDDYSGYNFSWQGTSFGPGDTYNPSISHGQQVAGIAGASTDNSLGIAGIGFNCKLLPLKIVDGSSLKYAYESIVYAAIRGIKVLNCSWGVVKPFSEIDQSIIDFAISKNVAIVAAAGNTSSKFTKYDSFFPASYFGVLGVGEVTSIDRLTSTSSISAGCRILAPGDDNYTTTNNGYFTCDGGTSFASPVVAGALALVRSKYPQLDALQSLEFVRQAVDRHNNFSSTDQHLIPGRINVLKSVTIGPFSIPGILPLRYSYFDKSDTETDRFSAGDEVRIKIYAKNVLGKANNLSFILSIAYDPANSVEILQNSSDFSFVDNNQELEIDDFVIRIKNNYSGNVIFRVDINGENSYNDFFKFNFTPAKDISTFANNQIKFSMSDIGEFGFSTSGSSISGVGFGYKNYGNQVYRNSSIMISENSQRVVYNSSVNKIYSFSTVKGFVPPDRYLAVYNDNNGGNQKIGLEIEQKVSFTSIDAKATKYDFKITNTSQFPIKDVSFGLYIDWDVSSESTKNRSKLLAEAIPDDFKGKAAAQAVFAKSDYPYFGSAAYSNEENISPVSAGLDYDFQGSFDNNFRIMSLNIGTELQSTKESDFGSVVGVKFNGDWVPGISKICSICVGAGDNESDLAKALRECLFGVVSVNANDETEIDVHVYPQPTNDIISLTIPFTITNVSYYISNSLGVRVLDNQNIDYLIENEMLKVNLSDYPIGVYYFHLSSKELRKSIKILKY
ncbi:hypothetical protein MASR1M45_17590 [Candidatus Kapaibacterium sp.]